MNRATNVFFMGKGGVGKSTSSALFSVFLAQKGFQVLIVSLDPAHNQSDIFERSLSDKPLQIAPNLSAIEIDQEFWIRQYLKDVHNQINRTYSYLTAFNLEKYFSVIKYSPGLEEYALILAFEKIQKNFSRCDYLIFDMPPTALGLRFFSLPSLSLIWIEHLLALRKEIIEKRDLITTIKLIKKEIERDKVLNKINELRNQYQDLKDTFEDRKQTQINLVLNPDKLSFAESIRIVEALQEININLHRTVSNKMKLDSSFEDIDETFTGIPMINFPYSETPLIGFHNLQEFLKTNGDHLEKQLSISPPNLS
jgi:arsenite/tail-anchored protein-transporting ATPase